VVTQPMVLEPGSFPPADLDRLGPGRAVEWSSLSVLAAQPRDATRAVSPNSVNETDLARVPSDP